MTEMHKNKSVLELISIEKCEIIFIKFHKGKRLENYQAELFHELEIKVLMTTIVIFSV